MTKEEEKGEFRPLVLKTDRESVLRGEDYWIDYSEVTRIDRIALEIFRTAAGQKFACLWVNGMFFSIAVRFTSNKLFCTGTPSVEGGATSGGDRS